MTRRYAPYRRLARRQDRASFGSSVTRGAGATVGCLLVFVGALFALAVLVALS